MDDFGDAQALAPLLAAFDAAAEEGHFTRAADRLGVPQSSLSRRIKTVEQQLGVALFQPSGRGVTLTVPGRALYEHTRGLVRALDDAVRRVRADADPDSGLVRFGFPLTLGPVSVPSLLAQFHTRAPKIRLHLVQAHGEALAAQVRDGRLDLAVMIPPPPDLPSVPLGRQRIALHVARTHPLAARDRVDLAELAAAPFIANPPTYQLRTLLDTWCAAAGFTPRVLFEITEFDTLRELVALGLGVALLPAAEIAHPDLVVVAIDGERDREIGLVSGDHGPTLAVARLRDFLIARTAHISGARDQS
ncbi:LysR family transcriptional regulator [Nocardia asteroides NBRC 15531]|uniref:LysR family transcriptional regulator n=1 Tax=Nocardia asteroides NBRC 15531 TaxID=1110697 RepID=U5EHF0_NOCAS|nr:LysR substrate-binding domain-containing protein [Nocardia asteroides]TLF67400.1 LysR family transcriptional regulator [Nocardia asteroides NBRC 15531]UGT51115.1 LysR substrate-binding domain-containing protein [Nocardia asteroides]SFM35008.1 DNA-binding transcriptional regulator, LysR family [Nocardia asteroides]VEG36016.1 HTH-type transcriptional regulator gltC [Nocardia asteroides]GAD85821.1 putative LysR family transcriptional regulator [Nocardia asteroides NBRC 15531]